MNKEQQIMQLEEKIHKLIEVITDPSLWNFLTDKERERVSEILQQV